jgi:hypothetical protein
MKPMRLYKGSPSKHESWSEYAEHSLTHDDVKQKRITFRKMRQIDHITTLVRRSK